MSEKDKEELARLLGAMAAGEHAQEADEEPLHVHVRIGEDDGVEILHCRRASVDFNAYRSTDGLGQRNDLKIDMPEDVFNIITLLFAHQSGVFCAIQLDRNETGSSQAA